MKRNTPNKRSESEMVEFFRSAYTAKKHEKQKINEIFLRPPYSASQGGEGEVMASVRRFSSFTDDEVRMLRRQAIESSCEITMSDRYSKDEIALHTKLLNEIILESKIRDYGVKEK